MLSTTLLCCLAVAGLPADAAPVEAPRPDAGALLQYRFTDNEAMRYQVEQKVTLHAAKGTLHEKNRNQSEAEQELRVLQVHEDGSATLRLTILSVRMESSFDDGEPTRFDSRSKATPPTQYEHIQRIVGQPMTEIRVQPNGSVADMTQLLPPEAYTALSASNTREDADGIFAVFPTHPVRVGEEWSDTYKVNVSVSARLHREVTMLRSYQLEKIENGIATIRLKTAVITPLSDPQLLVQLIQRQFQGEVKFDIAAGRAISRRFFSDNTEIGWAGADSTLRAINQRSEQLMTGKEGLKNQGLENKVSVRQTTPR